MPSATGLAHTLQARTGSLRPCHRATEQPCGRQVPWHPETRVHSEGSPQKLGGLHAVDNSNKPQSVLLDS